MTSGDDEASDAAEAICRICFIGAGEGGPEGSVGKPSQELISPCKCEGSQKYVHLGCLRQWQRAVQLGGSNHPEDRTTEDRHHVCNVCKSTFNLPPQDRASLMAELAGVMPDTIVPGVLLVTTRSGAQSSTVGGAGLNLALRAYVECKAAHFREAVYALTEIREARNGGRGDDVIIGVNLSRKLQAVPPSVRLEGAVSEAELGKHLQDGISVTWLNGGPVGPRNVSAMYHVACLTREACAQLLADLGPSVWELASSSLGERGEEAVVWGAMDSVLKIAAEDHRHGNATPRVFAWAGYAQWSRAQLLGEMARGSWGWCRLSPSDVVPPTQTLWNTLRYSDRLGWAPDNELQREFARNLSRAPAAEGPDPQAEAVIALAQQFEALRRGSVEPTGASLQAGSSPAHSRPRQIMNAIAEVRTDGGNTANASANPGNAGVRSTPISYPNSVNPEHARSRLQARQQSCSLQ